MRRILVSMAVSTALAVGIVALVPLAASATTEGKVLVCKYVGTPGVDETLQTGNNPIEVSVNAIPGPGPVVPGYEFADAQGRSKVVGAEGDCVAPTNPPPPPPTTPPPPRVTPAPACSPSWSFNPWHGDPLITINLTGPGTFTVRGGKIRATDTHVVVVGLACGQTAQVRRYHVNVGDSVQLYLNGTLVASRRAPAVNR